MAAAIRDYLPLHAQALLALERVVAGLQPGDRLPSERELSERLGISREPIRRAVQVLRDNGTLEARQGSGTFVRRRIQPRTGLLGISVPTIEWGPIATLVSGAEAAARAAGCHLVLLPDHGQPELQQAQIVSLMGLQVDGVLILPDRENPTRTAFAELLRQLAAKQVHAVMLDRGVPGIELPCVATDVARGMQEVAAHLLQQGRRRLAVISWGDEAGIAEGNRWSGLRAGLAGSGATVVRQAATGYGGSFCDRARDIVAGWLREGGGRPDFDAVVAFVDDMALGAFFALREAGLRIPADVAITGHDDAFPQLYQAHGLHLTTVAQPFAELGRVAVERLMTAIRANDGGRGDSALLSPRLVIRASTTGNQP